MQVVQSIDGGATTNRAERIPLVALIAICVPVLAAFGGLSLFVIAEAAGARPFAVAPAANVAEAAAYGDAARILAFVGAGEDPNARWEVRRGLFDADRPLHVTALQSAILARRPEEATLLLRHGARADPGGERLACLAQAVYVDHELPPSTFGAPARLYYGGPLIEGTRALAQCGMPGD